jgi:ribosomal-protein-alanine N-acetyltransferase
MNFSFPVLHTPRLTLRQVTNQDAPHLLPVTFYNGVPASSLVGVYKVLSKIDRDMQAGQSIHWGIEWREKGVITGTIGFYRGFAHQTGEVGYVLAPAFRRQGFMYEALMAVAAYGFEQLYLERIVAYTAPDNAASVGLLLKAKFFEAQSDLGEYKKFILLAGAE